MELYQINNLTFTYPGANTPALCDLSLTVNSGEFITICGQSGCGKSTLLRHLKTPLAPHGVKTGRILFGNTPLDSLDFKTQSKSIGFVSQNPENQIVTDMVWHELAFGLESLGMKTPEIRSRVAEMASYFGIEGWFHKSVTELSGGQKQLLNLASIMVMQPDVLLLDEPTGQLDPIAAADFLETLSKINRELGTTVILTEHRLEEAFAISDRIVVMEHGSIIADASPGRVGISLHRQCHPMSAALPTASRVSLSVKPEDVTPVTVRDGKDWLNSYAKSQPLTPLSFPEPSPPLGKPILALNEVYFRYEKEGQDVLKGVSLSIYPGECYAILGGNGVGKTTALSVLCGIKQPQRGEIFLDQKPLCDWKHPHQSMLGMLPQNPQSLFAKNTVQEDLLELLPNNEETDDFWNIVQLCRLDALLYRHPYDLSGGEQQRAALAKVLLLHPKILLLDEPTKGFDAEFKEIFAQILDSYKESGGTVVMVSHDIEFCAAHADRCGMFFDGAIVSEGTPRDFFAGKNFYTTAANRMARELLPSAVLCEDIIASCLNKPNLTEKKEVPPPPHNRTPEPKALEKTRPSLWKLLLGIGFGIAFLSLILFSPIASNTLFQILSIGCLSGCLGCLLPKNFLLFRLGEQFTTKQRKLSKRAIAGIIFSVIAVPLTVYFGFSLLDQRKYYFVSLLVLFETMLPFFLLFEGRKPQPRELILISVLCAIVVGSRTAFSMLPQFKPMLALTIIIGICFGCESGFLIGAVTAFVSNFFFGQGPWTPWQMFAFGMVGFLSGLLFHKGFLPINRLTLCFFGALCALLIYGGIMNASHVILYQENPTPAMFLSAIALGLPFDLIHAAATVFFLWFFAMPMMEKLGRMRRKYGIL